MPRIAGGAYDRGGDRAQRGVKAKRSGGKDGYSTALPLSVVIAAATTFARPGSGAFSGVAKVSRLIRKAYVSERCRANVAVANGRPGDFA